jgi:hypothetical protein
MERYRFLDFLSSRSLSVTTMPMQVEGVFLCSVFCSLTLLLEFERRKKSLSIGVLYCTSHKTRAMTNLQERSSLILCFSVIVPCFIHSHNSFCISQFLDLQRFHSSFPFIGVYTFICFSFNNFLLFYVYYNKTSCSIPNSIKYSTWI